MGRAAAVTGRADGRGFKLVLGGKVGAALRPVSDRLLRDVVEGAERDGSM